MTPEQTANELIYGYIRAFRKLDIGYNKAKELAVSYCNSKIKKHKNKYFYQQVLECLNS